MRHYPKNSPEAAARIVALAMIADGHASQTEMAALDRLRAHELLGLSHADLHQVIRAFCEDLLSTSLQRWDAPYKVEPRTLAALLAEVDDPALRTKVLVLCVSLIEADDHVAEGETALLLAALEHWSHAPDAVTLH